MLKKIFYLTSLGLINANIVGEFTASAVHKQIVVEKFCKNSDVINQSKCSSGILEHGTKCQTTCDDIRHEMICSCWRVFGPIQIEKDCVWEIASSDGVDGRSISDIENCKIEERRQPTCPELSNNNGVEWICNHEKLVENTLCMAQCESGMTLSWESEKLGRTWCHCDGDFCTWKQSLAALRRASETAGYLFPVDPVCHNSKSRLEGDIEGSPFCGALPIAADDSNSEIICHKTRHADGSMHTTRCRMLCNKGFILPKHAKKSSKCTKSGEWNYDLTANKCIKLTDIEEEITSENYQICDKPDFDYDIYEFSCPDTYATDQSRCQIGCKSGFIQNKNEKQSWVKCKCKRDGNCHFRRIENIHCQINDNLLSRIDIKPNMSINDTVSNLNPDRQTKVIVQMRSLIQNFEDENPDWETADDQEDTEVQRRNRGRAKMCSPMDYQKYKMKEPKCSGLFPGSRCRFSCPKGLKLKDPSVRVSYCTCGRKCKWSNVNSCV